MDDRDDSPRFHHRYTEKEVANLLGLREGWGDGGVRHVTIVDLLSWARDPGGDALWYLLALRYDPWYAWMARRGPLDPAGELATVLWDLMTAIRTLSEREQAVIALTAFGFTRREVARALHMTRTEVQRVLAGDEDLGREGVVPRVTRHMNGDEPPATMPPASLELDQEDDRGRAILRIVLRDPRARRWLAEIRADLERERASA